MGTTNQALIAIGENARAAKGILGRMGVNEKNAVLKKAAEHMVSDMDGILAANERDLENARNSGLKAAFIDRLTLTKKRVEDMAGGLLQVCSLPDPNGEVTTWTRPNGLIIGQKRVPIGVIGVIYEARPNVTADVFGLCFKTGNCCVLRGGKEALNTNIAVVVAVKKALAECGVTEHAVSLIEDTSRETATEFMKLNGYIDVLIPRGGAGLIRSVVENSTVPVIETGTGNCHIYCDKTADFKKAVDIVINAKTQRPGVCNAAEKLLVHEDIARDFLPLVCGELRQKGVEVRADERARACVPWAVPAADSDWPTEYEDMIMAVKVVSDTDEAIRHINKYSTAHSEAIITESYADSQRFLQEIDSAAVYVNASTRFTDGFEFGFGAEIGISTQRLHARGPMGLKELTTTKYIIYGNGQVRG